MSKPDSSWSKRLQVTVGKSQHADIRYACASPGYSTWAGAAAPAYYKLLSYFGRQEMGAHGPVCVPSVPETLSHSGEREIGAGVM